MTPPSGESGTRHAALERYLATLPASLLNDAFRQRISDRERRADYPFSVHNIYRVLFALAPTVSRAWREIHERRPLSADDPVLGTSLRCYRYLHVLLAGTDETEFDAAVDCADVIAQRAVRLFDTPACFCVGADDIDLAACAGTDIDAALRLATVLRQYADVRWLGQHDQGFIGLPPRTTGTSLWYTRCFGNLPRAYGGRPLHVAVEYDLAGAGRPSYDAFRGENVLPPPRDAAIRAVVYRTGDSCPLDGTECTAVTQGIRQLLRGPYAEGHGGRREGNRLLADFFLSEVRAAAGRAGVPHQGWRSLVEHRLGLPFRADRPTLTDQYLDALTLHVRRWEEFLCAGT
ncbi:hypothetical protein SALCHL_006027 [Streptomyces albus subsp. chlorinus]|uniref:hypothetical protein n=1 Tax=Streptomyces albus TaxID=1888 RepID=UPI0015D4E7CD|nr:hypothetical protein [Streptomyces albus]